MLYDKQEDNAVKCNLCSHRCMIKEKRRGICGVRENQNGTLKTLVYEKVIARNVDPIEKKPMFHFLPGTFSYSIATVGCNFRCRFCQNSEIAQMPAERDGLILGDHMGCEDIVADAVKRNCATIAYTYTEPTIFFEFAYETAKLAREKGIRNVFVTNGYMTPEAIERISSSLDAANVDLKSFSNDFYKEYCGARLEPVKETLKHMKEKGIFIEVTTLIIPGLNNEKSEVKALAQFIHDELGPDVPWHVSRFHPTYRLTDRKSTPVETLSEVRKIGLDAGLRYVYTGNVPGDDGEKTRCYQCKAELIDRFGFQITKNRIENGKCPDCGAEIYVVEK